MRKFKFLLIFFLFLISVGIFFFYSHFSAPQKNASEERYVIALNFSEEKIIQDLVQKGFLKDHKIFNFILTAKKWHKKIQPGAYKISKSMNAYQLAKRLVVEGPYQKWIIIPPGKRKEQVALILQKTLEWPYSLARNFANTAEEGYLYPDTYLINTDADPVQIFQKFKANFNEKFDQKIQQDLLAKNIRNDTAIKIASLIERESGDDEDKPVIAGIIWNRLLKGMKLEIDATVQYAIATKKLSDYGLQSLEDLDFWPKLGPGIVRTIDSPYNTYLYKGLPPGPICSPSLDSIKAVVYPVKTDALYYFHSPDKKIHTAKTLKEHQENIKNFLNF